MPLDVVFGVDFRKSGHLHSGLKVLKSPQDRVLEKERGLVTAVFLEKEQNQVSKSGNQLTPLGEKIFLDRYALKDGTKRSLKDGDTVVVLDSLNYQTTLRLAEVDCPEKAQAFGTKAKQFTSDAVYLKEVKY